jgi:ABC-2 type transport system ATP-binding protein
MSVPAIRFDGVGKAFRFFQLRDLSFELEPGQVLGLVGPNGAGKSTTIRLLMGLMQADRGSVEVLGHPMPRDAAAAKREIGYVADDMRLFGAATIDWHMRFAASIYPQWDAAYAAALLKRFNLHGAQVTRGLSRGEQVKALMLLVLARRPRLIVLDEPTSGLDPVARHELTLELMQVVQDEGRSILFSSHNTLDVERISDQIAFIDRGSMVDMSDKETFLERWRRLQLDVPEGVTLPTLPGVVDVTRTGRTAVVTIRDFDPAMPAAFVAAGARVHAEQRMSLEEIFVASVMDSRQEKNS